MVWFFINLLKILLSGIGFNYPFKPIINKANVIVTIMPKEIYYKLKLLSLIALDPKTNIAKINM